MKPYCIVSFLPPGALSAQSPVPEIAFDSAPNFFKLPADLQFGECSGGAVNSKGHVFVFPRANTTGPAYGASATQLLEFGPDDNIWAADKGSDMIVRFNPEGHVNMVFGRKKEASDEAVPWTRVTPPRPAIECQFRQSTDVAWDREGNLHQ
jgi:hypothetical protein